MPFTDDARATAQRNRDLVAIPNVFKKKANRSHKYMKRLLLQYLGFEDKCSECGINEWNGKNIELHLDHIDGDSYNNEIENLRFLCPNCHSQTETYCGKGNTGSHKVSDEELIEAIKSNINIRRTLLAVRLTPKGGNYVRVRNLMEKENLSFRAGMAE